MLFIEIPHIAPVTGNTYRNIDRRTGRRKDSLATRRMLRFKELDYAIQDLRADVSNSFFREVGDFYKSMKEFKDIVDPRTSAHNGRIYNTIKVWVKYK